MAMASRKRKASNNEKGNAPEVPVAEAAAIVLVPQEVQIALPEPMRVLTMQPPEPPCHDFLLPPCCMLRAVLLKFSLGGKP